MGLNDTPSSERVHIGFFGLRNAGKSSVVNAVTAQQLSLVSDIKGTTTDPVSKAMEILPIGPVVIIDTPGIDDEGTLGEMRVKRAKETLSKTDVAILVADITKGLTDTDSELISLFKEKNIPYIIAFNKCDLDADKEITENGIKISAKTGIGIHELKELIGNLSKDKANSKILLGDLINPEDLIVLVTPIDKSAPKARMILPQQQMIREVLDYHAVNMVVRETELESALKMLKVKPKMVITDSQAFGVVNKTVPEDILLTSFSILFARYKGELEQLIDGVTALNRLKDGDTVLISEGCTHHRQCNDIGTVKLPNWVKEYTGKNLNFEYSSGNTFPNDLSKYSLIIHCGGCMLNAKEVHSRLKKAEEENKPITNYGIAIAFIHGILKRSLSPFKELEERLENA